MADSYEFSAVLGRMLSKVPDTIDKREGSIIYNALAPTAYALAAQSYMLGHMGNLLFADTAEGEWLDRVVYDFGLEREAATRALRKITCTDKDGAGIAGLTGKRFAINDLTFRLTAAAETAGVYQAECEQYGTQGNCYSGAVLPVDNISGLGTAVLDAAPLIAARDDESDDDLRARFYEAVRQTPFGGNKADYREKTLAIDGVGACAVFGAPELAAGAGNVGIVIGDEQGKKASDTLVQEVQGLFGTAGDGLAPIGHTVTVKTAAELTVNVAASVQLKSGSSFAAVEPLTEAAITAYIGGIGFEDATIYYAKLVAEILNSHEAIVDVGTVTLGGASANLSLVKTFAGYQIPKLGTVTVTEVSA